MPQTATGQQRIAAERNRQIQVEGWTPEDDDRSGVWALSVAAVCYRDAGGEGDARPEQWPFGHECWKPKNRQRNLERAGALYQAAADVAERLGDYDRRNNLRDHVASCSILLDSIQPE